MKRSSYIMPFCIGLLCVGLMGCASTPQVPFIVGQPWTIAGDPDLGEFTTPEQQPVDFGVWQASDESWQLWSCIRGTKCGGNTRLFHRWEGQHLEDTDWKPMGIAMQADPALGETPGGLQAPFVFIYREPLYIGYFRMAADKLHWIMTYGDWENICVARSDFGKTFTRWVTDNGKAGMFSEGPGNSTRDPMLLRIGKTWYCYYTAHPHRIGAVYCRTSKDLRVWSESKIVARGGRTGSGHVSAECPFVVYRQGFYYLFRTQHYGQNALTSVYRSKDPLDFGVDDDRFFIAELPIAAPEIVVDGENEYIAYLRADLKGIQIARLEWK